MNVEEQKQDEESAEEFNSFFTRYPSTGAYLKFWFKTFKLQNSLGASMFPGALHVFLTSQLGFKVSEQSRLDNHESDQYTDDYARAILNEVENQVIYVNEKIGLQVYIEIDYTLRFNFLPELLNSDMARCLYAASFVINQLNKANIISEVYRIQMDYITEADYLDKVIEPLKVKKIKTEWVSFNGDVSGRFLGINDKEGKTFFWATHQSAFEPESTIEEEITSVCEKIMALLESSHKV